MYFQDLEYKGRNFLDLNDDNYQPVCIYQRQCLDEAFQLL